MHKTHEGKINETNKETEIIDVDGSESDSNGANFSQQGNKSDNSDNTNELKVPRKLKNLFRGESKFMSNFDPESSNREKRKLNRKYNFEGSGKRNTSLYDEHGVLRIGKDICDCLSEECVGCHFPCPKCRSYKCGQECRINRKWVYEAIENEGDECILKNSRMNVQDKSTT